MLKNLKPLILAVSLLCIAGCTLSVLAEIWVTSNSVHQDIQYVVNLSSSAQNSEINLNAAVTRNGVAVGAGIDVDFYYSLDGGTTWFYFATGTTDANGVAQAVYEATVNGGYDFRAIALIP